MGPLAAIFHPGGTDPNGYPVTVVHFISNWSEEAGTVTQAVCVTTDGAIHTFDADKVQIVDRRVAEAMVSATEINDQQRQHGGSVPPPRRQPGRSLRR
jgi:hypothetical protein